MGFLKETPAENGLPPHMMTVDFRAAKGAPATLDDLYTEAGAGRIPATQTIALERVKVRKRAGCSMQLGTRS